MVRKPASPADMFGVFMRLALQGFGGVLPVAQRTLVEQQCWLTREQFLELLSLSQILPGPNIVNLSLILGDRHFGWRGAVAAASGVMLAPLLLVLLLAAAAQQLRGQPLVGDALRGMGVVAAGLVLSTAIRLGTALKQNVMGPLACTGFVALTVLSIGLLRWPLVGVVGALGAVAVATAWWRMRP